MKPVLVHSSLWFLRVEGVAFAAAVYSGIVCD
jgi:hypothetical protein